MFEFEVLWSEIYKFGNSESKFGTILQYGTQDYLAIESCMKKGFKFNILIESYRRIKFYVVENKTLNLILIESCKRIK